METNPLLNIDSKLISVTLALRIKDALPSLMSPNQTAYTKNRFISESDIMIVSKQLNIKGYLVTLDAQKACDSVNHFFLPEVLKAFGFGKDFLYWTKILLTNQEPCVLSGGTTTKRSCICVSF